MDVNKSEFLAEFMPEVLFSEVTLALNSKQGKSRLFWLQHGRERGNNVF